MTEDQLQTLLSEVRQIRETLEVIGEHLETIAGTGTDISQCVDFDSGLSEATAKFRTG